MKHKILIAGCGGISRAKLEALRFFPDMEVVAFVDLNEDSAKTLREESDFKDALISTDQSDAIQRSGANVVFDATVPGAHKGVTLTALEQDCHVLGEKPLSDSMESAEAMVAAAKQSGQTYAVVQNRRCNAGAVALKNTLESGLIGDVVSLHADFFIGAHFGGFREEMRHVLLLDMAIHLFDAARFFSGRDAVSVFADDWNPKDSWYAHGAAASALFRMADGIRFTFNGSWCAEGLNTPWDAEWRIVGTRGSIKWDGAENIEAQTVVATEGLFSDLETTRIPVPPLPEARIEQAGIMKQFFDALELGTVPPTVCSDNIKSLQMVFAAIDSAEKQQIVHL